MGVPSNPVTRNGCAWQLIYMLTYVKDGTFLDAVQAGIAGIEADTGMKRSTTIDDNWVPIWNEEFEFDLRVPELAVLRLEVHEDDKTGRDDFAGQTCLPVSELKPGYRVVALRDEKGDEMELVKLLLKFELSATSA